MSISVRTMPNKTVYHIGEALDTTGLTLYAYYNNNTTKTITSGFTTSALDSSTPGEKTITVTYQGKTATFKVTVEAPNPYAPAIEVEQITSTSGKEVSVKVCLKNNPGVSYIRLTPSYDSSVLTLVGVDFTGAELNFDNTDYSLNITLENGRNVSGDGLVFTMKFRIADNAEEGVYPVSVIFREAYDLDESSVSFSVVSGSVEVVSFIYGDVNGDGVIDGRDIIRIRKYLSAYDDGTGESPYDIFPGADCNGDGKIDGRDLIRLRKYIASYDDETGTSPIVLGP
jgi:hypothetical protein